MDSWIWLKHFPAGCGKCWKFLAAYEKAQKKQIKLKKELFRFQNEFSITKRSYSPQSLKKIFVK